MHHGEDGNKIKDLREARRNYSYNLSKDAIFRVFNKKELKNKIF